MHIDIYYEEYKVYTIYYEYKTVLYNFPMNVK